ncbi:thiol reductant ABC exporter subunit CydC [Alkalihalobacillus sp. LMS39]|uniref:thiol reductant ABC exporter subunit CydC n=1 Tax=Alkalihalobacillus sp. LMS39 TaxID=2924032 RepID=UPI001FB46600|nr:thiol reductant ABC exporter subunit CydC [Alkalihalobacillus sp. LMS39]UOE94574.1 thiol reductant ABC exporter subunit CydC [Alkalihalobacillus sp. LMS39]
MKQLLNISKIMMKEKKDVYLSIIFGFLAGMTAVALFAANGYLISAAALQPPLYVLISMVAVVKIGSFIRATSRYGERYFSHRATFTMLSELRIAFYEKLETIAPKIATRFRSGDLLARVVGDVETLQNFFLRVLYPPIIMALVFLSTVLFLTFFSLSTVVLLVVGLVLTGVVIPMWFAIRQKQVGSKIREKHAILSTEVTEWFKGFRELKVHQQLHKQEQQLIEASDQYIDAQERDNRQSNRNESISMGVALGMTWLILLAAGYAVSTNQLDGIYLAMLVMVSLTVFDYANPMSVFPIYYDESQQASTRLAEVTNERTEQEQQRFSPSWKGAPSIDMREVCFTFPNESRPTLRGVNLSIKQGTKTAIVGPSGCGKSTLLQMILGLHKPDKGYLLLDGQTVHGILQEKLWEKTNVVLQENHFFYGTVKENLLLEENAVTDEDVEKLLHEVELGHIKASDQVLEKGENLSGGEKQRLAMARVFARENSLWLLDEPTSSLDGWTEQRLFDALFQYANNATVVVVSHRLQGLEKMDEIIVMDEGEIIEQGTFEQLMQEKGYFYQLKQIENSMVFS